VKTRPFRGWEDLSLMQGVCSARLLASPGRAVAHPGDIAWWVGWHPSTSAQLADGFLLWEEDEDVVAFAAWEPDDGDLAVFVLPALADGPAAVAFEDAALAWAYRTNVSVRWVEFEDEEAAVARWNARGFLPTDEAYVNLTMTIDRARAEREPDHRVRPVGDDDLEGRARVTYAAFDNDQPFDEYVADYAAFRASPAYPNGWDLLLRDADGRAAACCIAWPDPISGAGTFEPVATHPDLHRRGFGHALLLDGLRRFAAAGMTYAIVGAAEGNPRAEALYRSVGFRPDRVLRVHARPEG
jgi:ribosomal protein S18 acetylase RimI-like enzyme